MPKKKPRLKRKDVERFRLRSRENKLREPVGKLISEAEAYRLNLEVLIRDFEPIIARDRYGNISFSKRPGAEQLERAESAAKAFLEKYHALRKGHETYEKTARAAGVRPVEFGRQLAVTREGKELGQVLTLAGIEAERVLKAVEMQREKEKS